MTAPADGQGGREDYCPRMGETCTGVCPDCNAEVRALIAPTPVRGVGTGQGEELRDELADWLLQRLFWGLDPSKKLDAADELLAGPLADLVAAQEAAEWISQFAAEAIREVHQADATEPHACDWCGQAWPCDAIRALDGTEQQGRDR